MKRYGWKGQFLFNTIMDNINPHPQKRITINPYPSLDPGQDSDHGSRKRGYGDSERDWTDRQFPESMEQTGLHGSQFESLTELARAKVAQF
jgi:hypothetical protein